MNPEYSSDYPENELANSSYDWITASSTQSSAFDFPADPFPPREELVTSDRPNTKVAIPRIVNPNTWTSSTRLIELTAQVETYKALLKDLYPRLDVPSALHVDQTLKELSDSSILRAAPEDTAFAFRAIDYTDEDFNRDEKLQAMGFVGEHSEMAWLYRVKRDLDQAKKTPGNKSDPPSISSVNYFQDDCKISVLGDVDLSARPPQHVASHLVDSYFRSVHPTFPIIGMTTFIGQFNSLYTDPKVRPGKRWLAVLNLIFAITARHYLLMGLPIHSEAESYLVYFTRAWRLGIDNVALLSHPNLQQVQVEGLAAFYLLSVGQVNRSWIILGVAIRSAVTMGLNLRNESSTIGHLSKEIRYRVWWALFMLDTVLCVMTGRPPSTSDTFCSTPLPLPYTEEEFSDERIMRLISDQQARDAFMTSLLSTEPAVTTDDRIYSRQPESKGKQVEQIPQTLTPNVSLYFLYTIDLAFLTRKAVDTLYAPRAPRRSWREIEFQIFTLNSNADRWLSRLPVEFHFVELDASQSFAQERASLAFRFYTTKLIISQHCLRRLANLSGVGSPGAVCDNMAAMCVHVAGQILDLLPDEVDTAWLYKVSPWWCILHHIMQSSTILLIALSTQLHTDIAEEINIAEKVKKATRWLNEMSAKDPCSQRALLIYMDLLSRHASKLGLETDLGL
ncbi:transcriptional regulator family: Fungal Specific TF [Penicillium verhagenii]|uniref:transcriptional regulator family: Fungal Specific TF n=1 Tax=Penicillium verhagenii TaxID=1562060 RepID=UPI002544F73C|nr:transcriptional regulator family: Fungal Specific TF [Penicillium verhagenii]KAJ5936521.1 transcriptional regulator family: Fungal Specific TF [Penicillium verhagenii]